MDDHPDQTLHRGGGSPDVASPSPTGGASPEVQGDDTDTLSNEEKQLLTLATLFQTRSEKAQRDRQAEASAALCWIHVGASWAARLDAERARSATRDGDGLNVTLQALTHRFVLEFVVRAAAAQNGASHEDLDLQDVVIDEVPGAEGTLETLAALCDASAANARRVMGMEAAPQTVYWLAAGMYHEHRMNAVRCRQLVNPTVEREPPASGPLVDLNLGLEKVGAAFGP